MTAIKARGETPFSEAGDGVVLCFTNANLKILQAKLGKQWMPIFSQDLVSGDIDLDLIEDLVKAGAKKDRKEFEVPQDVLDGMIIAELTNRVLDALYVAVHGQTFKEYIDETAEAMKEAAAKGAIPPRPSPDTTSSTISEEDPSGPESE